MKTARPAALSAAHLPLARRPHLRLHGRPKYSKPIVPTYQAPDAFHDAYKEADPSWHPATPADSELRGDWWTLFGDAGLNDLETRAILQNQSLKSYAARYAEARAQIGINRAAQLPTIGTAPVVQGIRYSAGRPYFNAANLDSSPSGVPDLQLPLTSPTSSTSGAASAAPSTSPGKRPRPPPPTSRTAQLSIQSELAMDYFELRTDDAQAQLLADTVKDYQEALRITTNRFEGGVSNEADVFQARTQLQAAIVQQTDIAVQRAQYEHAIAILIGQPPNSFTLADMPLSAQPPPSRPACPPSCSSAAPTSPPPNAAPPKPTNASASPAPPSSPPSASPAPPALKPTPSPASSPPATSSTPRPHAQLQPLR